MKTRTMLFVFALCLLMLVGCGGGGNNTGVSATGAISVSNPLDVTITTQNSAGAEVVAKVFLNEMEKGFTPLEIKELPPGTYTLLLRSAGYKDYTTSVVVQAGTTTTVAATYTLEFLDLPEGPVFTKQ